MSMVRVSVYTPGRRVCFTGLYASTWEAIEQATADWPEARAVSAVCIKAGAA